MKGKSIIEVISVFIMYYLFIWLLTDVIRAEIALLGWSYIAGILLILIPVIILRVTKRDFGHYGFTLKEWRYNLNIGMKGYLVQIIPLFSLVFLSSFQISYTGIIGGSIIAAIYIPAILLLLLWLRRSPADKLPSFRDGLILVFLLIIPIILGLVLNKLTSMIVSTVIWQFIFSGFGEEIMYRGYYQSRINEEFGRPYSFLGVNFGIGLIISSLLFAMAHILNPFNPFEGSFDLAWGWGLWTFFGGLFFGFIREKTGSILAAGIAHGLPDAFGEALAKLF